MYQKRSEPVKSLLDFSLFVTFFPDLVAGRIVRPPQLVPQFESPRKASLKQFTYGLLIINLRIIYESRTSRYNVVTMQTVSLNQMTYYLLLMLG